MWWVERGVRGKRCTIAALVTAITKCHNLLRPPLPPPPAAATVLSTGQQTNQPTNQPSPMQKGFLSARPCLSRNNRHPHTCRKSIPSSAATKCPPRIRMHWTIQMGIWAWQFNSPSSLHYDLLSGRRPPQGDRHKILQTPSRVSHSLIKLACSGYPFSSSSSSTSWDGV